MRASTASLINQPAVQQLIARDISPEHLATKHSQADRIFARRLMALWQTPAAIRLFEKEQKGLTSYGYWYFLGTLWVAYTGWSDLSLWKELFASTRKNRDQSLMKPSELRAFQSLPDEFILYRAHRPAETDWIAYTLDPEIAAGMAYKRRVREVHQYKVNKGDALALFLRRGEREVLVLDKHRVRFVRIIPVFLEGETLPDGTIASDPGTFRLDHDARGPV